MRFYIDEDPPEALGPGLRAIGHEAVTTGEVGNKGLSDVEQLAYAAEDGRVFVTCNRRDFELLHEGLLRWSRRWGITAEVHSGVVVLPSGSRALVPEMIRALDQFAREGRQTGNRLWRWKRGDEWSAG